MGNDDYINQLEKRLKDHEQLEFKLRLHIADLEIRLGSAERLDQNQQHLIDLLLLAMSKHAEDLFNSCNQLTTSLDLTLNADSTRLRDAAIQTLPQIRGVANSLVRYVTAVQTGNKASQSS